MNPEPIDSADPWPKPDEAAVIVTTAGPALAAIWTIGWLALPLVVGTVVLVLVSWAGAVLGVGDGCGQGQLDDPERAAGGQGRGQDRRHDDRTAAGPAPAIVAGAPATIRRIGPRRTPRRQSADRQVRALSSCPRRRAWCRSAAWCRQRRAAASGVVSASAGRA